MTWKNLIFILFLIFSTISFLRLFRFTSITSPPILPPFPFLSNSCASTNPVPVKRLPHVLHTVKPYVRPPAEDILRLKEHQLLKNLITHRAPCNLLFFGLKPQFLDLAMLNTEGTTIFLEDDLEKLRTRKLKGMGVYLVKYHKRSSEAYELLKHARTNPACTPQAGLLHRSHCKLALTGLPGVVRRRKWDVVVVDGPRGDQPEAPGRMGAIYTAAMVARASKMTDVLVHDIDRMIEKWYSWEFLCHENLVSSKGKLWHFRIKGNSSSTRFCSEAVPLIQ
ncbi:probable methyltransferase At1g27930 [Phoenix dactylifera]|uniref:Probable methyltransferase At1g27930 n=1 Tax=Phoenix dactylifera TaxID=42345 RepID=A0A8B7CLS3_PHODC|nr:probable methyltransferase At1g27930 [Phoenix dactylifera]